MGGSLAATGPDLVSVLRSRKGLGDKARARLFAWAFEALRAGNYRRLRAASGVIPRRIQSGQLARAALRRSVPNSLQQAAYLLAGRVVRWEKVSAYHRKLKAEGKKPARRYRSIADQQFRVRCAMVRTRTCFDPDSLAGGPPPDDALTSRAGGSSPPPSANSQMPAVGRGGRACAPQLRRGTPPLDLTGTPTRFPRFPTAPRNPPSSSLHSRTESIGRTGRRSRGRAVKESSYMRFRPPAAGCADLQVGIAARRRSETGTAAPGNGAASPVRRTGWGSPSLPIRNDCAEETAPPNTLSHVDGDVPHPQPDAPRTPRNHPPHTSRRPLQSLPAAGAWLSLAEHLVRDQGVAGSNPAAPTRPVPRGTGPGPSGHRPGAAWFSSAQSHSGQDFPFIAPIRRFDHVCSVAHAGDSRPGGSPFSLHCSLTISKGM